MKVFDRYPFWLKYVYVSATEKGFLFEDGQFVGVLHAGRHWYFDPLDKYEAEVFSLRTPWLESERLDLIVKSGVLKEKALVLDLKDEQRALVFIDGRFERIVAAGLHALWTSEKEVRAEIVDASEFRFTHRAFNTIVDSASSRRFLQVVEVPEEHEAIIFRDGKYMETLKSGRYAYWLGVGRVSVFCQSLREQSLDVSGQEIMTADKVTLRMNALVTFSVTDSLKAVTSVEDNSQMLYREAQLALRATVGSRQLDKLLAERDEVAAELLSQVSQRAKSYGLTVVSVGIKDIILPGDMKTLLNKVTEAKKAAEANLIFRREETAAMRSQANTAKLLEANPMLMRLRELELLEKIAGNSKLSLVLGEKGLADRLVNLL